MQFRSFKITFKQLKHFKNASHSYIPLRYGFLRTNLKNASYFQGSIYAHSIFRLFRVSGVPQLENKHHVSSTNNRYGKISSAFACPLWQQCSIITVMLWHGMNHGKHDNHTMIMQWIMAILTRNMAVIPSSWFDYEHVSPWSRYVHDKILSQQPRFSNPRLQLLNQEKFFDATDLRISMVFYFRFPSILSFI